MNKEELLKEFEKLIEEKLKTEEKITSLYDLKKGDLIEFNDGAIGLVGWSEKVNSESCEDEKCIFLIKRYIGDNWGQVADSHFNLFKEGDYKRIIRNSKIKIVEEKKMNKESLKEAWNYIDKAQHMVSLRFTDDEDCDKLIYKAYDYLEELKKEIKQIAKGEGYDRG